MKTSILLATLLFLSLTFSSCRKEGNTVAKIHVRDTSNVIVSDAQVILYGVQDPNYTNSYVVRKDTAFTDVNGTATFDYTQIFELGQYGFANLNIIASKDSLSGTGIIKVEAEKTSEKTIVISP